MLPTQDVQQGSEDLESEAEVCGWCWWRKNVWIGGALVVVRRSRTMYCPVAPVKASYP